MKSRTDGGFTISRITQKSNSNTIDFDATGNVYDGEWKDVWVQAIPPVAAKVTVYKLGSDIGFSGVALFREYAQTNKNGEINSMWSKMSTSMLEKCAESKALRKAFPRQLGGMYTSEEMAQADNPESQGAVTVLCSPAQQEELRSYPKNKWVTRQQYSQIMGGRKAEEIPENEFEALKNALYEEYQSNTQFPYDQATNS